MNPLEAHPHVERVLENPNGDGTGYALVHLREPFGDFIPQPPPCVHCGRHPGVATFPMRSHCITCGYSGHVFAVETCNGMVSGSRWVESKHWWGDAEETSHA